MKSSRLSPPVARRGFVRPLLLLAVAGFALLAPQGASTAPSQPASNPDALAGIRPETRLRKLHLVRPDLIPYPIAYEVYC